MNMRDYPTLLLDKNWNRAFIAVQHFSHSSIFNNEYNSLTKLNVKQPLMCSWAVLPTSVNKCYIRELSDFDAVLGL